MVDSIDEIAKQARQGSVAAIIQLLNRHLAAHGVRTRAVFVDGVLQLLCEAAQVDRLEQPTLVEQIRHILENISPRYIRRVNINSRLVREHQLLWLEEISRDPENQLLWSQQITLKKPNPLKLLARAVSRPEPSSPFKLPKTASASGTREQQQFQRGIAGGIGLSLSLLLVGLGLYNWLSSQNADSSLTATPAVADRPTPSSTPNQKPVQTPPASDSLGRSQENFARAVRLAEQASADGKIAQSIEEWQAIAAKWQEASELMASVAPEYPRYETALDRAALYQKYSEQAQQEAQKW